MATALGLHVGRRIREAREGAGLRTQQELADKLPPPINNQYVSKWEGGVKPKEETLALIAAATGKEVAWFYEGFQRDAPDLARGSHLDGEVAARLDALERDISEIHDALLGDGQDRQLVAQVAARLLLAAASLQSPAGDPPESPPAAEQPRGA